MKHLEILLSAASTLLCTCAVLAQTEAPCSFLSKPDAESILGESVVQRANSNNNCWYVQNGFAGGTGPNNKQISFSIYRSASPKADSLSVRRADIARDPTMAKTITKDVPGFADAAIWSWIPNWGRFNAFKGGIVEVEIIIAGIPEDAALRNAKKLAERLLGAGKSGFAYAGTGGGSTKTVAGGEQWPQSPASYTSGWMGQSKVIRGTVSRIEMKSTGSPQWLTIFFKESPDAAFVVCSPYPDMFQDTVGDLYKLVGKTLEVSGPVEGSMCAGQAGSIRVLTSKAYRLTSQPQPAARMAKHPARSSMEAYAGLDICNAGEAPFDAIVARRTVASSEHLAPRDCAHVYEENGAPPAYVGFAFADARGQWAAPRRIDLLPNYFGSTNNAPTRVWSAASENVSIRREGRTLSVPAQLLFSPPTPTCTKTQDYSYSAVDNLPLNATPSQRAAAQIEDNNRPANKTVCLNFDYTLNVVAYPDTREVTFYKKCYECPPRDTPAEEAKQRATIQQTTRAMSQMSPLAGGVIGGLVAQAQTKGLEESIEGPPEFRRMSWSDMKQALAQVRPSGRPPEMPQYLTIRATVERVDVDPPQASEHWVYIHFRESPEFDICTSNPQILEDVFGPDFRSRMIGQTFEVQGEYQRSYCKSYRGSIRVSLAHQLRKVAGIDAVDPKARPPQ